MQFTLICDNPSLVPKCSNFRLGICEKLEKEIKRKRKNDTFLNRYVILKLLVINKA
jgi:hypothetical protein